MNKPPETEVRRSTIPVFKPSQIVQQPPKSIGAAAAARPAPAKPAWSPRPKPPAAPPTFPFDPLQLLRKGVTAYLNWFAQLPTHTKLTITLCVLVLLLLVLPPSAHAADSSAVGRHPGVEPPHYGSSLALVVVALFALIFLKRLTAVVAGISGAVSRGLKEVFSRTKKKGVAMSNTASVMPEKPSFDELSGWCTPDALVKKMSRKYACLHACDTTDVSVVSRLSARSENQDYGLAFTIGKQKNIRRVLVSADGLGGHRGGRPASFTAARAIIEAAGKNAALNSTELMSALLNAAETEVQLFAQAHFGANECLTTCIVAIVDKDHYHVAWLGDGGVQLRRANAEWSSLMYQPHRSADSHSVTGLLGPKRVGEWRRVVETKQPGDWFLIGSDGAMDGVGNFEEFFDETRKRIEAGENLHTAMDAWWAYVEEAKVAEFSDNITAVLVATPPLSPSPVQKKSRVSRLRISPFWDATRPITQP